MIRRPPRSTQSRSSAASDVYKRQVMLDTADIAGIGNADDDRQLDLAAGAVAHLGNVRNDLLEGRVAEGIELHLDHGAHAIHGHADGRAHDSRFGEGRIADPGLPEFSVEAVRYSEHPAEGPHVFSEEHDGGVGDHRVANGGVERGCHGEGFGGARCESRYGLAHFSSPVSSAASSAARACLLYTSPSPRDGLLSRMPSSA